MRFTVVGACVIAAWTAGVFQAARAAQAPPTAMSTWSGVYTEEQAKTGATLYAKNCAECHGQDLAGDGFAPGLKGPEFMNNWNGLTLGELFDRIKISMPPSDPNAVNPTEKAAIIAYLLKQGGFPAGQTALASSTDQLKTIKFTATKP